MATTPSCACVVTLLALVGLLQPAVAQAQLSVVDSTGNISGTVSVAQDVVLTFSTEIAVGTGNVTITDSAGDVRRISVNDPMQVRVEGARLAVNPVHDLMPSTTYSVLVDAGAVVDAGGALPAFPGILDVANLTFTTGAVIYAAPLAGNAKATGSGTSEDPYQSIGYASTQASPGDTIYVIVQAGAIARGYKLAAVGVENRHVFMKPAPGGLSNYSFVGLNNWRMLGCRHLSIEGFVFDGLATTVDHWTMLSTYVWDPEAAKPLMGGIALNVQDASHVVVRNNVFQHLQQKAVNIEDGRYVVVEDNVIFDVATKSLSGGHGIMRQQNSGTFGNADLADTYRWDIRRNVLFNVEQRIYSWVPSKGYLNMVLDEGKPINIDETFDTEMKARIAHNIIAFASIDSIRLKPTPNLVVEHNSIYSTASHADGITDAALGFMDPFPGLRAINNLIMTAASTKALELGDASPSAGDSVGNVILGGGFSPATLPGVTVADLPSLFVDPERGDFTPAGAVAEGVGVSEGVRVYLHAVLKQHNITVQPDSWITDHLKNTQTMLDNMPGVHDGDASDGPVFTSRGVWSASELEDDRTALYLAVNEDWRASVGLSESKLDRNNDTLDGLFELVVPDAYSQWYAGVRTARKQTSGEDYDWIRYGDSVLASVFVTGPATLTVFVLHSPTDYTVTSQLPGTSVAVTLAGDALVDLQFDVTPLSGNLVFDLVQADEVTGSFGHVHMHGLNDSWTHSLALLTDEVDGTLDVLRLELQQKDSNATMTGAPTAASTTTASVTARTEAATATTVQPPHTTPEAGNGSLTEEELENALLGILGSTCSATVAAATDADFVECMRNTSWLNAVETALGSPIRLGELASTCAPACIDRVLGSLDILKVADCLPGQSDLSDVTMLDRFAAMLEVHEHQRLLAAACGVDNGVACTAHMAALVNTDLDDPITLSATDCQQLLDADVCLRDIVSALEAEDAPTEPTVDTDATVKALDAHCEAEGVTGLLAAVSSAGGFQVVAAVHVLAGVLLSLSV